MLATVETPAAPARSARRVEHHLRFARLPAPGVRPRRAFNLVVASTGHQESQRAEAGFATQPAATQPGHRHGPAPSLICSGSPNTKSIKGSLEQVIWENPNTGSGSASRAATTFHRAVLRRRLRQPPTTSTRGNPRRYHSLQRCCSRGRSASRLQRVRRGARATRTASEPRSTCSFCTPRRPGTPTARTIPSPTPSQSGELPPRSAKTRATTA